MTYCQCIAPIRREAGLVVGRRDACPMGVDGGESRRCGRRGGEGTEKVKDRRRRLPERAGFGVGAEAG